MSEMSTTSPAYEMSFAKREYEFLKEIGLGPRNSGSYIDGVWQGNGSVINLLNPADNQPIAEVVEASIQDYEEGMQACADATKIWMQVLKEFADADEQEVRKSQYKEVLSDILLGMAAGLKRDPVVILCLDGHDLHDFINHPTFDPEMLPLFSQINLPNGSLKDYIIKAFQKLSLDQGMPPATDPWVSRLESLSTTLVVNLNLGFFILVLRLNVLNSFNYGRYALPLNYENAHFTLELFNLLHLTMSGQNQNSHMFFLRIILMGFCIYNCRFFDIDFANMHRE